MKPSSPILALAFSLSLATLLASTPLPAQERAPVDSEPTREVEVLFRTTWLRDPLSGIGVELGIGRDDDPLRWLDRPVLARATSDADGLVRATLRIPERWIEHARTVAWARVETPGRARTAEARRLALQGPAPTDIVAHEGATWIGTVHDASGEPVPGAGAWLAGETRLESTTCDARGRFALDAFRSGTYALHARDLANGSGTLEDLRLDVDRPPAPVEIVSGGAEHRALRGRVIDQAGAPVVGLAILALPAGFDEPPGARELVRRERQGRLFGGATHTLGDGIFELPELVDGEYALRGCWTSDLRVNPIGGPDGHGVPLGRVLSGSASGPVDLVLEQHRLELRLRGEPRVPLAAARVSEPRRAWLGGPRVDVMPLVDGVVPAGAAPLVPRVLAERVVHVVEPDRDYLVTWLDETRPLTEIPVHVDRSRPVLRVEIVRAPPCKPAVLSVHALAPDGTEYDEPSVRVSSAATGYVLPFSTQAPRTATWRNELPPGRYRVRAGAEPISGTCVTFPPPLPRAPHRPAELEVELLSGEERTVEIRLLPAGHLDLERLAAHGQLDVASVREALASPDLARVALDGGLVTLVSEDGTRVAATDWDIADLWTELDWLVPGWPARCLTPLPPGRWTLRVESESGVLFERELDIAVGETTVVSW